MGKMTEGVSLTPLKIIAHPKGDILRALKASEDSFKGFGEAYFSTVIQGEVKAWKKHLRMTLNLTVPAGAVKFVIFDDRPGSSTRGEFFETILSRENYMRLTVPPGIWMGFSGSGPGLNMLLNIADMEHDPDEALRVPVEQYPYRWNEY
jgi:dTDP-4-dehydrorhamnose 3,5-epimerase